MSRRVAEPTSRFGGDWTAEKLLILGAYLDAYTTALKNQRFRLIYVDAFAGSGAIATQDDEDGRRLLEGSPVVALAVEDRPFDELIFVERDPAKAGSLNQLVTNRDDTDRARVIPVDANEYLPTFCAEMGPFDRAVVFLDPFGTEVEWATVASLAVTQRCDVWILFPSSRIRRFLLPRRGRVRSEADRDELIRVFGDDPTDELQRPVQQPSFFDPPNAVESEAGTEVIVSAYQRRLERVFAKVARNSRTLTNSNNVPLYEFMFAAGNPAGAPIAIRIADYLLEAL